MTVIRALLRGRPRRDVAEVVAPSPSPPRWRGMLVRVPRSENAVMRRLNIADVNRNRS